MKKVVLALMLLVSTAAYSMETTKKVTKYPFTNAWRGTKFIAGKVEAAGVGAYRDTKAYVVDAWKAGYATAAMKLGVAPLAILAAIGVMTEKEKTN